MIKDTKIIQAVSSISQRAERQRDMNKLVSSYVEVGILPQLINNNNQILFGRRGTGKTHILKYFENQIKNDKNTVIYIDCRVLGSSPQFSDTQLSLSHRCSSLFKDILDEIYDGLLNHIAHQPNSKSDLALNALTDLSTSSMSEIQGVKKIMISDITDEAINSKSSLKIGLKDASYSQESGSSYGTTKQNSAEFNLAEYEKIVFPDLNYQL